MQNGVSIGKIQSINGGLTDERMYGYLYYCAAAFFSHKRKRADMGTALHREHGTSHLDILPAVFGIGKSVVCRRLAYRPYEQRQSRGVCNKK